MRKVVANKGQRPKALTGRTVRRVARAVNAFERGDRDIPGRARRRYGLSEGSPVHLGKTTAAWDKGTLATIELYEEGTPPSEAKLTPADTIEDCVNKFIDVESGKWVIVAEGGNGSWYLIAAEC